MRLLGRLEKESIQLEEEVFTLAYFSKGALTENDAWELSFQERIRRSEFIEKFIKQEKGIKTT